MEDKELKVIRSGQLKLIDGKKELVMDLVDEMIYKKRIYEKAMKRLKKRDDITEAIIMGSGSIAISSLVVTISTINPIALIVGTVFSSISTVGTAIKRVFSIREKYESCKTTYNQYSDLLRETRTILVKNHLSSQDLTTLLNDINNRMSLIEDASIPLKG